MRLQRTVRFNPALFTVVPLINVLFLVLVFFALSSTFLLQPGISVALPVSSFTLGPQRNPLMVTIAAQPALTLYFQDRRLSLDEFGAALANLAEKDRALVINADREVPYDVVMRVTNEGLKRGLNVVLATSQPPR